MLLSARYKLKEEELNGHGWELLEAVGRRRGMLISGGEVDTQRASVMVLDEFRAGKLGRITLEYRRRAVCKYRAAFFVIGTGEQNRNEGGESMTNREFDEQYRRQGVVWLGGIDEAGQGPLAGPVFAAAVVLDPARPVEGLDDSKKLSEKKAGGFIRSDYRAGRVLRDCQRLGGGDRDIQYSGATFLAMRRAAEGLDPAAQKLLVDGNRLPPQLPSPAETIVKGDTLSESVAAASILAKVSRDRLMAQLALNILNIIFDQHKGVWYSFCIISAFSGMAFPLFTAAVF